MVAPSHNLVKKLLKERGITQQEIADHLGVSKSLVNQVVNFKKQSSRVQLYIQLRLKKRYEELWLRAA